jgi:PKD repeat protein
MNKLFILLLSIVIFASCSKTKDIEAEPVEQKRPFVDFEVVPGDDPFTFDFKNNSKEFKKLEWRFGDDSVSYETTPSHIFATSGTFEVNLTAIAEDGSTAKKVVLIKIIPDSAVNFVAASQGSNKVKFSVKSSKVTVKDFSWDFGDGSNGSTDAAPIKEYGAGNLYTAKLKVTTEKGSVFTVSKLVTSNGTVKDITLNYLLNVGPKFIPSARVGSRWGIVADWRVNEAVLQREGNMGGWDEWDGNSMSMESWGGEPDIVNGKIQQTTLNPLPAGQYYYTLDFVGYQWKNLFYTVIAKGGEIPDVDKVENNPIVLGYTKSSGNPDSGAPRNFTTAFTVPAESPVTVGFVATFIDPDQYFRLRSIKLYQLDK